MIENFNSLWIREEITPDAISFAEDFGTELANDSKEKRFNTKKKKEEDITIAAKLTTSQLRKFFGEVKRQQIKGYRESSFILLKPKLAYAVGRANDGKKHYKIEDLYNVLSEAIDIVVSPETKDKEKAFHNFIAFFEAIVAYHKKAEDNK